jgi:hypothetical protein
VPGITNEPQPMMHPNDVASTFIGDSFCAVGICESDAVFPMFYSTKKAYLFSLNKRKQITLV